MGDNLSLISWITLSTNSCPHKKEFMFIIKSMKVKIHEIISPWKRLFHKSMKFDAHEIYWFHCIRILILERWGRLNALTGLLWHCPTRVQRPFWKPSARSHAMIARTSPRAPRPVRAAEGESWRCVVSLLDRIDSQGPQELPFRFSPDT